MGDGKGGFRYLKPKDTGFVCNGETRALLQVPSAEGNIIVAARNNSSAGFPDNQSGGCSG
jgi:hypothetical protein